MNGRLAKIRVRRTITSNKRDSDEQAGIPEKPIFARQMTRRGKQRPYAAGCINAERCHRNRFANNWACGFGDNKSGVQRIEDMALFQPSTSMMGLGQDVVTFEVTGTFPA